MLSLCGILALSACSVSSRDASDYAYSACYDFDGKNATNIAQAAQMDEKYSLLLEAFQRRETSTDFYMMCDQVFGK
jgi:hypothetical protein